LGFSLSQVIGRYFFFGSLPSLLQRLPSTTPASTSLTVRLGRTCDARVVSQSSHPASCVLHLINRLCAIHWDSVMFVIEYYTHPLRATGVATVLPPWAAAPPPMFVCPLAIHLHCRPMCAISCASSVCNGLHHVDWVFITNITPYLASRLLAFEQDCPPELLAFW
jgi:hypothetical protein